MNFAHAIAQIAELATTTNVLFGVNASLSAALIALYRDCRSDRGKLWEHVRDLEKRIGK